MRFSTPVAWGEDRQKPPLQNAPVDWLSLGDSAALRGDRGPGGKRRGSQPGARPLSSPAHARGGESCPASGTDNHTLLVPVPTECLRAPPPAGPCARPAAITQTWPCPRAHSPRGSPDLHRGPVLVARAGKLVHLAGPGSGRVREEQLGAREPQAGADLSAFPADPHYSWSPTPHFSEERCSPAPRNMRGLSGSRNPPQLCSGHTCGLAPPDGGELAPEHLHHGPEPRQPYLLGPADGCPLEHRCSPRSSVHSECVLMPVALGEHVSSSTFPRMHCSAHHDARDDGPVPHVGTRANRLPASLLDQFEKQLPPHRDGFHTLQYQRASAAEPRGGSPGRIRHLVHSVQKLFTKSHSLEGPAKNHADGARPGGRLDDQQHGQHARHGKRSKSRERRPEGRLRAGLSSWWGSDDNLDSDSTYRASSVLSRHALDPLAHCYPEPLPGPFGELSLKTCKSNSDVKCSACEGFALTPDAKYMKRSSWSTLTVSQAKEAYRKSSLNLDKPLSHPEVKPSLRSCHYLQVRAGWAGLGWGGPALPGSCSPAPPRGLPLHCQARRCRTRGCAGGPAALRVAPHGCSLRLGSGGPAVDRPSGWRGSWVTGAWAVPSPAAKAGACLVLPLAWLTSQQGPSRGAWPGVVGRGHGLGSQPGGVTWALWLRAPRPLTRRSGEPRRGRRQAGSARSLRHSALAQCPGPAVRCRGPHPLALTGRLTRKSQHPWAVVFIHPRERLRCCRQGTSLRAAPVRPPRGSQAWQEGVLSLTPLCSPQVPQDEWGGYPMGGKDEIPCRRMRSGSYIKAMGDEESGESDSSPRTSPTAAVRPEPLLVSVGPRPLGELQTQSYLQAASDVPGGHSLDPSPKFRSRNQSYMRAVSTLSQASCVSQVGAPGCPPARPPRPHLPTPPCLPTQPARCSHPTCGHPTRSLGSWADHRPRASATKSLDTPRSSGLLTVLESSGQSSSPQEGFPAPHRSCPPSSARPSGSQQWPRRLTGGGVPSCACPQVSEAEVNGQLESVCESVFGEVESQAMEALGLPGCFRTRSHSYLRAIQAGYSQEDECVPVMVPPGVTATVRSAAAVSYTNYKKTPPPVPPRTTSKPLISVTAQSSTESTQDAYQDGRAQRGAPWAQDGRGLYDSTDSLDSTKALSLALETAAAQRLEGSARAGDKAMLATKAEAFLQNRHSSVGIQVETATDSDTESRGLREYHSVGVQVEDEKRHGRFKRSNSVTAAVQADLELEGFPGPVPTEDKGLQFGSPFQRRSEPSTPTQYGALRTVRTQGLFSYREDYRAPADTASLPAPEPWLEPAVEPVDSGRVSPCRRDGAWFLQLLHAETTRMEGWCAEMEREAEEKDLVEETLGKIRSAVGSAQLLMSQKFQQFYWLCQQNMDPGAMPRPTSQDLAGYWDMLQLSVEDVSMKFDELQRLKLNDWRAVESPGGKEERKIPPPIPKKPPKARFPVTREKSLDLPDRQRQEARRRLMAAKRAASFRQNSATERADSIEIYIPEAQTRL
ncbi:Disks large-associated protein 2 [Galemys pyrenaicus]|uniref:Disks large-associated protein 2 n=1 Tax=Galemys pyrenaicus TaxID=202257 RepID=A0A8J6DRW4_GALPY|nr:Disks large-associated protein 2 [Galemys pyrenaicus]